MSYERLANVTKDDDDVIEDVVRISPGAYLRTMAQIAWNAIRHPMSTTTIDMETGKVVDPLEMCK
jgi:tetrahydrodipicolinate N-succinyltransferase